MRGRHGHGSSLALLLVVAACGGGKGDDIRKNTSQTFFCDLPPYAGPTCWRDWYSTEPLEWDCFRNAASQPDPLRQRVALSLQQVLVVSNNEVSGTYGFRLHHNNLLRGAFGNHRDVLRKVVLSPVMGEYPDHVNNDRDLPNENVARELLQLFSIGTCALNLDGTLVGPQFGIHSVNAALERLNWLTQLLDWDGSGPDPSIPNAIGTKVNLQPFEALAGNAGQLVDNLSLIALGRKLDRAPRIKVINAVSWWDASTNAQNWKHERAATAACLVFASPDYQVQR